MPHSSPGAFASPAAYVSARSATARADGGCLYGCRRGEVVHPPSPPPPPPPPSSPAVRSRNAGDKITPAAATPRALGRRQHRQDRGCLSTAGAEMKATRLSAAATAATAAAAAAAAARVSRSTISISEARHRRVCRRGCSGGGAAARAEGRRHCGGRRVGPYMPPAKATVIR